MFCIIKLNTKNQIKKMEYSIIYSQTFLHSFTLNFKLNLAISTFNSN